MNLQYIEKSKQVGGWGVAMRTTLPIPGGSGAWRSYFDCLDHWRTTGSAPAPGLPEDLAEIGWTQRSRGKEDIA